MPIFFALSLHTSTAGPTTNLISPKNWFDPRGIGLFGSLRSISTFTQRGPRRPRNSKIGQPTWPLRSARRFLRAKAYVCFFGANCSTDSWLAEYMPKLRKASDNEDHAGV